MIWQDVVVTAALAVFALSMLPALRKMVSLPLGTTLPFAVASLALVSVNCSFHLYGAAVAQTFVAGAWAYLSAAPLRAIITRRRRERLARMVETHEYTIEREHHIDTLEGRIIFLDQSLDVARERIEEWPEIVERADAAEVHAREMYAHFQEVVDIFPMYQEVLRYTGNPDPHRGRVQVVANSFSARYAETYA